MNTSFVKIRKQVKIYLAEDSAAPLVLALGGIALVAVASAFYFPLLFFIVAFIVLLGIAFFIARSAFKLGALAIAEAAQKNQVRALIENVKEGVVLYDTNFKILEINRAAEELFQISAAEVVGRFIEPGLTRERHLKPFIEVMFPSLAPAVSQISEAGRWPQVVNVTLEEPKLILSTTLYQVTNEKKQVIGFLKLVKDLTREKELLETKSEFLTVAAHQLRTPLTAIKWSLENLTELTKDAAPEVKKLVRETSEISDRAVKVADDLLDASKIEEGRFGYQFEEIDVVAFLKKLVEGVAPVAKQYGVRVYFESSITKPLFLKLDPLRMHTALMNLIDNAIRYNTKNGEVFVSVGYLKEPQSVTITVRDTGVGIPKESQAKLFEKFYRGENVIPLEPNGSGLGLFITKNIIVGHGGDIGFESEVNRGTTFRIILPFREKQTSPIP